MTGFYIQVTNGLLSAEHRKRMGSAVWEFMWLLDKITMIDEEGVGLVMGGKPINLTDIKDELGIAANHISENLTKLKDEGYIDTIRTPHGLIIKVYKAKKRFNQKVKSDFTKRSNGKSEKVKSIYTDKTVRQDSKTITNVIEETSKEAVVLEEKKTYGNPDINEVQAYFLLRYELPREDCTQRESRQYWQLLLNESKSGVIGVKWLIDQGHADEFLRNNITSAKDLYYKRVKILARQRGNKPKIAVMPTDL